MSIFNFTDEQSLGEVRSVETSRITVRVTDGQRLQKARVGRLVAIQSMGDEWLIGIIERVWRHPVELPTLPEVDPPADLAGVPQRGKRRVDQLGRHLSCSGWAAQGHLHTCRFHPAGDQPARVSH